MHDHFLEKNEETTPLASEVIDSDENIGCVTESTPGKSDSDESDVISLGEETSEAERHAIKNTS